MASKMVMDRQRSAEAVAALSQAQSVELASQLSEQLGLGDFNLAGLLDRLAGSILDARSQMVEADQAHEAELADDPAARDARDEAARALGSELVELREIVTGVYGRDTAERVFPGATPRDPVQLARFAGEVAGRLGSAKLGEPRLPGAGLDVSGVISGLETHKANLNRHLANVAREARESQSTLVARDAAMADYDEAFTGIATVFEGLFILARQRELAARVRPSRRRPGQTAESDANEPTT